MPIKSSVFQCPICNSNVKESNAVFSQCQSCRAWIRNQPDIKKIDERYKSSWDFPHNHFQETGATVQNLAAEYVRHFCYHFNLSHLTGYKILDFGAGRGELTMELLKSGADVYAFEPYGFDYLNNKSLKVFRHIDDIGYHNDFDIIFNIDVIEHVMNAIETLSKMKMHLRPGGWLYTATPNSGGLNALIARSRWREAQNPGHLCLFSNASLELALAKSGFLNVQRLKWIIGYSPKVLKKISNWMLTKMRMDGELRYLCQKPNEAK